MGQAVERGLAFELSYAPALSDSNIRRALFSPLLFYPPSPTREKGFGTGQGRQLMASLGRKLGKGLILSSGAARPIQLRGPFDAAVLLTLFGGTAELGRQALSRLPSPSTPPPVASHRDRCLKGTRSGSCSERRRSSRSRGPYR